jgi:hypothetical protein
MSRSITLTLGAKTIEAPTDFRALEEVNKRVGCPLAIMTRGGKDGVNLTQLEALNTVAVAMRMAGDKRPQAIVAESVYMDKTLANVYYTQATRYLIAFFSDPDKKLGEEEGAVSAE